MSFPTRGGILIARRRRLLFGTVITAGENIGTNVGYAKVVNEATFGTVFDGNQNVGDWSVQFSEETYSSGPLSGETVGANKRVQYVGPGKGINGYYLHAAGGQAPTAGITLTDTTTYAVGAGGNITINVAVPDTTLSDTINESGVIATITTNGSGAPPFDFAEQTFGFASGDDIDTVIGKIVAQLPNDVDCASAVDDGNSLGMTITLAAGVGASGSSLGNFLYVDRRAEPPPDITL